MPFSDGFYESLGCDLIHFPYQMFALCALPSVFNPHDLQYRHFPQFFTVRELAWREMMYRGGCNLAQAVAVGSQWVKEDVVRQYHISPDKIQVIPWAPPTTALEAPSAEAVERVRKRYALSAPFAFYPAMGWEHKNHLRLLEALALLRDREGLRVNLVCTVSPASPFYARIRGGCEELKLGDQVQFLGLVLREELRSLYRLAQFVVVPTLFEAASGPVFEAWQDRAPVACSTATSLPEQAGDAALLFDPLVGRVHRPGRAAHERRGAASRRTRPQRGRAAPGLHLGAHRARLSRPVPQSGAPAARGRGPAAPELGLDAQPFTIGGVLRCPAKSPSPRPRLSDARRSTSSTPWNPAGFPRTGLTSSVSRRASRASATCGTVSPAATAPPPCTWRCSGSGWGRATR